MLFYYDEDIGSSSDTRIGDETEVVQSHEAKVRISENDQKDGATKEISHFNTSTQLGAQGHSHLSATFLLYIFKLDISLRLASSTHLNSALAILDMCSKLQAITLICTLGKADEASSCKSN
jgi:hypothetical protein